MKFKSNLIYKSQSSCISQEENEEGKKSHDHPKVCKVFHKNVTHVHGKSAQEAATERNPIK